MKFRIEKNFYNSSVNIFCSGTPLEFR